MKKCIYGLYSNPYEAIKKEKHSVVAKKQTGKDDKVCISNG